MTATSGLSRESGWDMSLTSPETEVPTVETLKVADRCDELCNAQAYVRVLLPLHGMELSFCKHHFEENELSLMAKGAVVIEDIRAQLV